MKTETFANMYKIQIDIIRPGKETIKTGFAISENAFKAAYDKKEIFNLGFKEVTRKIISLLAAQKMIRYVETGKSVKVKKGGKNGK